MFQWLRKLFRRRSADDRLLFAYWDGEKDRRIDPLVAWRAIWNSPDCDFAADAKVAMSPTRADGVTPMYPKAMVLEAEDRIGELIRTVFGVKAWSENCPGLTVDETQKLLADFLEFVDALKKKRNSSRMPSPASDSTEQQQSPASTARSLPTSVVDSGCTASELSGGEPSGPSRPFEACSPSN